MNVNIYILLFLLFGVIGFFFFDTKDDDFFKTDAKLEKELLKPFEQKKQKEKTIKQENIESNAYKKDKEQKNKTIKKYSIVNNRKSEDINYNEKKQSYIYTEKSTINTQQNHTNEDNINYPQESDEELNYQVEDKVSSSEITPQFKQWKTIGNIRYNIFVKKKQNSFSPPSVPVFAKVKVDDKKTINVAIPPDKESYIAIKKGDNELEVKEIKEVKKEVVLLPPPQIGD